MKLPGGETSVVPSGKLAGYLLDIEHPHGGNKARVFRAALGLGPSEAHVLEAALLGAARQLDAEYLGTSVHGDVYRIEFMLEHSGRSAWIRSGWLVPHDGSPTRLTTAIVRRRSA